MKKVPSMPASLDEALTCLEEDHAFLTKGDVFSEELIETFVSYKRKSEAERGPAAAAPLRIRAVLRHLANFRQRAPDTLLSFSRSNAAGIIESVHEPVIDR